jgi:hypothetical protein
MQHHYHQLICLSCYGERVPPARAKLGYKTCLSCGEKEAASVRHCVVPMNKSNYIAVTDRSVLAQLNPKRTV